jgi:mannose/fructose/N-acetylgalactosamine-specific phosphotransferase system component IIC
MLIFDAHTVLVVVCLALAGGLIGLDKTAVGQFMISQPIVAAPLTGWLLGDAAAGLVVGVVLELIWLLDVPVGTFVPADSTVASIVAVGSAVLGSPGGVHLPVAGFSIFLTVVLAPVTMTADRVVRQYNSRLADALPDGAGAGLGAGLGRAQLRGACLFFLKFFSLILIFVPLGIIAVRVFLVMPAQFHRAMAFYLKLLPLLGAALVARRLTLKTFDFFLAGGFLIAAGSERIFHAPAVAVIALAAACAWFGVNYHERRA